MVVFTETGSSAQHVAEWNHKADRKDQMIQLRKAFLWNEEVIALLRNPMGSPPLYQAAFLVVEYEADGQGDSAVPST
jgi:hypothetical protein